MALKRIALGAVAALGIVTAGSAAETLAHWSFGEHGLENLVEGSPIRLKNENVEIDSTGYAIFNGTNACLETEETLDLTAHGKVTFECWLKILSTGYQKDFMPLLIHYPAENELGSSVVYFGKGEKSLRSQVRDGSDKWTYTVVQQPTPLPCMDGGWHHLALVIDLSKTWSEKARLYVDGVRQAGRESNMRSSISTLGNYRFLIGGGGGYVPGCFFHGFVDDVRITADALEPEDFLKFPTVGRKMSAEKPTVAYWPFGQTGLGDATGNGFDLWKSEIKPGQPVAPGFGNDCVQLPGGAGLYYPNAFPADAFSNCGLTYEFFFRTTAADGDLMMLLENSAAYYNAPGRQVVYLEENRSKVHGSLRMDFDYNMMDSVLGTDDPRVNDGEWHHVATVYDPKRSGVERYRVYLDGRELQQNPEYQADVLTALDGGCSLFLGCRGHNSYVFVGEMDDVRVMPWALTPDEFLKERSVAAPLARWRFDNAETALADLTGNGHGLVNKNGVTFTDGSACFNGQNAHLVTADAIDLSQTSQVTIEGNFYFEEFQKIGILFNNGDTTPNGGFVLYGIADNFYSQFRTSSGKWQQHCRSNFRDLMNGWHHIAFVVNLANMSNVQSQFWIDGELVSHTAGDPVWGQAALLDDTLAIGGGGSYGDWAWDAHASSFKGRLADLAVTPTELVPATFKLLKQPAAAQFVAKDDFPKGPLALDLTEKKSVTVECFVRFDAEPAGSVFSFAPTAEGASFALAVEDDALVGAFVPTTGGKNRERAVVPADRAWHHLALVIDEFAAGCDRVRLYVDGVRSAAHLERVIANQAFGAGALTVGDGFAGKVTTVRVMSGALTPDQFLTERGKPGALIIVK